MPVEFFRYGNIILPVSHITSVNLDDLEKTGCAIVTLVDERVLRLSIVDSYDLVMQIKPSALEGKRLKWLKNKWLIHNVIGHPVMQLLAFFGFGKLGIKIHEATIPTPVKELR
jgi:hypothetical protein